MGNGKIKGITIEIDGNTRPLEKSLGDLNKKTRDLQGELKSVERLLKLDPGNTELLAQKQRLLAEQVENSAEKLNRLKAAQEQVNQAFQRGDLGEEQYRHFSRQVINAEQDLKKFENQLQDVNTAAKKAGLDIQGLGEKLKGTGQSMSLGVTAPIVGGFLAITEGTKELRGDLATLATNANVAGQDMGILNDAMVKLQAVTGETDSNVEGLSELLATGFRDEQLSELLDSLYGASIKFKDTLKFEGIADGLQETLATGAAVGPFGELLERSGIQLDGFNAGLKDAIKNGTEEQYILDVLAKTGLAETYEAYRKNNEEMIKAEEASFKMELAMAKLGATLAPILTPIIDAVTQLVNKFNEMSPAGQKIALVFAGIAAAIGPILVVLGSAMSVITPLVTAIGGIGTAAGGAGAATTGMGAAIAAAAGPIAAIITVIALVVAAIKDLWQNNEGFRTAVTDAWNRIKESINDAAQKVKEALDKIKAWWVEWGPTIKGIIGPIWDAIKAIIGGAVEVIANVISLFLDVLTGDWDGAWKDIKGIFQGFWDAIVGVAEAGAKLMSGVWDGIKKVATEKWNDLKSDAQTIWDGIKSMMVSPIELAYDLITGIIGKIVSAFTSMQIDIPTPRLPKIGWTWKNVSVGGTKINIPDLYWYAKGGIFDQPSIIGVGEAGKEAVIPVDKLPGLIADALRQALGVQQTTAPAAADAAPMQPIELVVKLDGRVIAQGLYDVQQTTARGRGLR